MKKKEKKVEEAVEQETVEQAAEQPIEGKPLEEQPQQPAEESKNEEPQAEDWEAKYKELNDAHLRLMADFDNYRKRNIKEKADLIKNASERVVVDFLPIVDNFERALQSMEKAEDVAAVREGVELIYNQVMGLLKNNGVTLIETEGLALDTDVHDAITTIPAPTPELKDKIVDCVKKGYKMNDKVIRHAQVVVGN